MQWQQRLTDIWYQPNHFLSLLLAPFSFIYEKWVMLRRWWYQRFFKQTKFDVPIIIVGNITVGGTGKTPLVIWLATFLSQQGYRPGIVSRGYGGKAKRYPLKVDNTSDALITGDEAILLAKRTDCPVVIDPDRVNAVKYLLASENCNIIISDDGLQHYALDRQIEIAVIDGDRRFGNARCLPAGPLREPVARLRNIDFIVTNTNNQAESGEYVMQLKPGDIYNLAEPGLIAHPNDFAGQALHAIAGIGNPERFFKTLRDLHLSIWPHRFPDHYHFSAEDIQFESDAKVIMTEKDAVKCKNIIDYRYWCLPVTAVLGTDFINALQAKLALLMKYKVSKSV